MGEVPKICTKKFVGGNKTNEENREQFDLDERGVYRGADHCECSDIEDS